jgi:hypothetical protein
MKRRQGTGWGVTGWRYRRVDVAPPCWVACLTLRQVYLGSPVAQSQTLRGYMNLARHVGGIVGY